MYRFKVGQRVKHEEVDIKGTIVKLVSFDEDEGVRVDVVDPETPWYDIMWDGNQSGFEHDLSLIPI